ncbi:ferroportin-like [Apostichopus japonicus]|uniref:ferroportin-like n=1 Tax=Stichopus japonicus TaxID=307972 RepID=UPI003AB78BBB
MSNSEAIVDNDELAQEYEKAADEQTVSKEETAEEKTGRRISWSAIRTWLTSYAFFVYASQALSSWGDRMWSFAVGLYLVEIDGSLRLTAIYGFSLTASVLIFGAVVGRWVDRTSRLRAIQISLFLQNSFVAINAAAMCVLVVKRDELPTWVYAILAVAIICLGVCAKLTSIAEKICVQKDWIVVIAGEDKEYMAGLNASVRRIDLLTNILAPIVVGQIMTFASLVAAGVFISAWNVISMFVEYILLYNIYISVPALAEKKKSESGTAQAESLETDPVAPTDQSPKVRWNPVAVVVNWLQTTYDGLKIYKSYDIFWGAFGLACLYMTVMGFDSVTTGYGYALGVPEYMLGIFRALGSLAGILGTVMFTFLRKRIGIVRSGLYCLAIQITMLSLCIASIFVPGSPFDARFVHTKSITANVTECLVTDRENVESHWSAGLFFGGMILSRIGLWAFDLVLSQQIQESVEEHHRGIFNGIQSSLQSSFDMIHFILVIGLPCPESFGYLIFASYLFVCLGAAMYARFSYKKRGHILPHHLKECVSGDGTCRVRLRGH